MSITDRSSKAGISIRRRPAIRWGLKIWVFDLLDTTTNPPRVLWSKDDYRDARQDFDNIVSDMERDEVKP